MEEDISNNRPTQLKSDTRQWNSGRVKFAVIGWKGKPDRNYIILENYKFKRNINITIIQFYIMCINHRT